MKVCAVAALPNLSYKTGRENFASCKLSFLTPVKADSEPIGEASF